MQVALVRSCAPRRFGRNTVARRGRSHLSRLARIVRYRGCINRCEFGLSRTRIGHFHLTHRARRPSAYELAEVCLTSAPKRALQRGRSSVFSWRAVQISECCSYTAGGWATARVRVVDTTVQVAFGLSQCTCLRAAVTSITSTAVGNGTPVTRVGVKLRSRLSCVGR